MSRGFHPINWGKIRLPKDYGGLGFKKLTAVNKAFGTKLAWKLISGNSGLWAEVLLKKYMLRSEENLLNTKNGDSQLWKFICQHKDIVEEGARWQLRNGESIYFFSDIWLFHDKKIQDMTVRPLMVEEKLSKVVNWTQYGSWDFVRLSSIVSNEVISKLISILPPSQFAGEDIMLWDGTQDGSFTTKSA